MSCSEQLGDFSASLFLKQLQAQSVSISIGFLVHVVIISDEALYRRSEKGCMSRFFLFCTRQAQFLLSPHFLLIFLCKEGVSDRTFLGQLIRNSFLLLAEEGKISCITKDKNTWPWIINAVINFLLFNVSLSLSLSLYGALLHDASCVCACFYPLSAKHSFQLWYPGGQRLKVISFSWFWVKSPSKCFSNTEPTTMIASRDEKRCNASVQWARLVHSRSLRLGDQHRKCHGWLLFFAVPDLHPDPKCCCTATCRKTANSKTGRNIESRKQAPQNSLVSSLVLQTIKGNHRLTSSGICLFGPWITASDSY